MYIFISIPEKSKFPHFFLHNHVIGEMLFVFNFFAFKMSKMMTSTENQRSSLTYEK